MVFKKEKGAVWLLFLCLGLFLFSLYFWFPGQINGDSFNQLHQIYAERYDDHHPVIMAWLWSLYPKPLFMLTFHLMLYWSSFYIFSLATSRNIGKMSLVIPLIGLYPPLFGILGVLSKDIGMGCTFLFCSSQLYLIQINKGKRINHILFFLALIYGINVRHNAIFAGFPLIYFWIRSFGIGSKAKFVKNVLMAVILSLIVRVGFIGLSGLFISIERSFSYQQIIIEDLVALTPGPELREYLEEFSTPGTSWYEVRKIVSENKACSDHLLYDGPLEFNIDKLAVINLGKRWIYAIGENPVGYLKTRFEYFKGMTGFLTGNCKIYHNFADDSKIHHLSYDIHDSLSHYLPFYKSYIYVLISILGLIYSLMKLRSDFVISLYLSSIFYVFPYFLISVCCDFRYTWWGILSSVLATVLLIFKNFSRQNLSC